MAEVQTIRLWTWQLPDWDIRCEARDPTRGAEAWGNQTWLRLQALYPGVEALAGTSDVVWCCTRYEYWGQLDRRRLWELGVPISHVLAYVDSHVWNSVLFAQDFSTVSENEAWRRLLLPSEKALRALGSVTPLLRVPLRSEWVRNCDRISRGPGPMLARDKLCVRPLAK